LTLAGFIAVSTAALAVTDWVAAMAAVVFGLLVVVLIAARLLQKVISRAIVWLRWSRRGIRCVVVTSNSPHWSHYIRSVWLQRMGDAAVVLNWSERVTGQRSQAVPRVFRHYLRRSRDQIPAVVVFRGLREPYEFRFFYAFQEARHGRRHYLEELERQMFEALDTAPPTSPSPS
jgi:hypothetical protein